MTKCLSPRESAILQMLSDGLVEKEIVAKLNLAGRGSLSLPKMRIKSKLGAVTMCQAVKIAVKQGIVAAALLVLCLPAHAQTAAPSAPQWLTDAVNVIFQQYAATEQAQATAVQANAQHIDAVDQRISAALAILNQQQSTIIDLQNKISALQVSSSTGTVSTSTNGNGGALASPVVVSCAATSCAIAYTTLAPVTEIIAYYPYGNTAAIVRLPPTTSMDYAHSISISGLTPATKYVIAIQGRDSGGAAVTLPSQIQTTAAQ